MNNTLIKSALHNLSMHENNNRMVTESQRFYYKGLIVGIVSALMDYQILNTGKTDFLAALKVIKDSLPDDCLPLDNIIPDWVSGLQ